MHTIIHPLKTSRGPSRPETASRAVFRQPHFDCQDLDHTVVVTVYVPGVDAAGVEITAQGPDLTVTARKAHFVRVNWQALHLESAQRDYRVSLRLGRGLDYDAMEAAVHNGVLTLSLPKRPPLVSDQGIHHSRVA